MALKTLMTRVRELEARLPWRSCRQIVAELPDGSRFVADTRCPQVMLPPEGVEDIDSWWRSLPPAWHRVRPGESLGPDAWIYRVPDLAVFAAIGLDERVRPGETGSADMARPQDMVDLAVFASHPWSRTS